MAIRVRSLGYIRSLVGEEVEIEAEALSASEIIRRVTNLQRGMKGVTFDTTNTLVVVNGVEISALDGAETVIREGDEVVLIPAAHGG